MLIDIVKQTPAEYSKESRDYQIIARLYSALFNISKMYIDDMEIWNSNIDNKLVPLRSRTVNFIPKHTWDTEDLEAVTSCFKYIMRYKGTEKALEFCINVLLKINNSDISTTESTVEIDRYNNIDIWLGTEEITLGIIEDLVRYLLPAGMTYRLHNENFVTINSLNSNVYTDIYFRQDRIDTFKHKMNFSMFVGDGTLHGFGAPFEADLNSEGTALLKDEHHLYYNYIENTWVYGSEGDIEDLEEVEKEFYEKFRVYVTGHTLVMIPEKKKTGEKSPHWSFSSTDGPSTFSVDSKYGEEHMPSWEDGDDGNKIFEWHNDNFND